MSKPTDYQYSDPRELGKQIDTLKAKLKSLAREYEIDWQRIQDAERQRDALEAQVRELEAERNKAIADLIEASFERRNAFAENKVLRDALLKLRDDAFTCMEGADDPAFSDYERFCSVASQALKTKPAQGGAE